MFALLRTWFLPIALCGSLLVGWPSVATGWRTGRAYAALDRVLALRPARDELFSFTTATPSLPSSDDVVAAQAAFASAADGTAESARLRYGAGLLALATGAPAASSMLASPAPPRGALGQFQLGLVEYRSGDTAAAAATWRSSGTDQLVWVRAHAALAAGRFQEAGGVLRLLAEMHPEQARSWLDLGELSLNQQDWSTALDAYQHALALDPGNLDARYMIGYTQYYGQHDAADAREAMQAILASSAASDGQRLDADMLLGRMDAADGKTDAALGWYQQALQLRGALHLFPLREMASIYAARGQPEQAEAALKQALLDAPGDATTLLQLGQLLLDNGQANAAIPYLERAVSAAPDDPAPREALAKARAR